MNLEIGQKAPKFSSITDSGTKVSNADYKGKYLVLYFYPKDDTSTCTIEACSFRDVKGELSKLNAEILGVSPDNEKSHLKFKNKFKLNFDLMVDEDHKIADAYGVWGEKSMFGKKYMGVIRSTFIIAPNGKIAVIFPKVVTKGHTDKVIKHLKELQSK